MSTYPEADPHGRAHSAIGGALAPYLGAVEPGPFAKLSISLPDSLLAEVRAVAAESGVPVSGVIAASLRRLVEEATQARLDAALEADNAAGLAFAEAAAPMHASLLERLPW